MEKEKVLSELEKKAVIKRIKKIKRTHKLYFRGKFGELRKLDSVADDIYGLIMVEFLQKGANKKYRAMNNSVKRRSQIKPLPLDIGLEFSKSFLNLCRQAGHNLEDSISIYYGGSDIAFAQIQLIKATKIDTE